MAIIGAQQHIAMKVEIYNTDQAYVTINNAVFAISRDQDEQSSMPKCWKTIGWGLQ